MESDLESTSVANTATPLLLMRTDTTTWATQILQPSPDLLNGKDVGLHAGAR